MHRFGIFSVVVCVITTAFWTLPATAEEGHGAHGGAAENHGGGGNHDFKNVFALFLGVTNEPGHGTEPTWGLEYGRKLSPHWSVGGIFDYAGGDQRNAVIAPAVFWRPVGGLVLTVAPGVEWHNGRGVAEPHLKAGHPRGDPDETFFVLRLGAAYVFHVGSRYGVAPAVNLDLVDGHEVWIYGVNFEVMF